MKNVNYNKTREAIKYWLLGKAENNTDYYKVIKAMNFAQSVTTGFRKDGKTPVFQHQISIALYLKSISTFFINPVEVFVLAFLHDVYEDFPETEEQLAEKFPEYLDKVKILSKRIHHLDNLETGTYTTIDKPYEDYFNAIANDESCSLVKAVDRIHNLATMIGVFNTEKQKSYCEDVYQHFLPMLKKARVKFPEQENAYENLKSVLTLQVETTLGLIAD